ncbi:NAD(P)-binding protein [Rickenella mellea]|uniref:enoyl-[acyl-carrier-protein] reductase n=1 Tax=Rickenella mellea TaxID=50990 RepID=A0A4Y7QI30_9AGAM|nr:NAD(P)-binding protein [Rickenella mellea]
MPTALTFAGVAASGVDHLNLITVPSFPPLKTGEVLLKTLAAPINPIDLIVLKGGYPVKPKSTIDGASVPGYDGILEVVESADPAFAPGDVVMPKEHGFGTWRTHAVARAADLQRVPRTDPRVGAILKMGACVAWVILADAASALKPGDWIIQNGATSVVAQLVIQMARLRGFKTISVIRDRSADDFTEKKRKLEALGGDIVMSEGELERGEAVDLFAGKNIGLALDCVFGESGQRMAELLSPGGTFVAFGQLSGANSTITLTMNLVFFKNLTFRPFRLSKALAARSDEEMDRMLEHIIGLFNSGQIKVPELEVVHWDDGNPAELSQRLRGAVEHAQSAKIGKTKSIFVMT